METFEMKQSDGRVVLSDELSDYVGASAGFKMINVPQAALELFGIERLSLPAPLREYTAQPAAMTGKFPYFQSFTDQQAPRALQRSSEAFGNISIYRGIAR